jgi:drug/metabolite transporter (DMT)-like permease
MLLGSFAFAWMGTLTHALASFCDWRVIALVRTALALIFGAALVVAAGAQLVFFRPRILWVRSIAGSVSLVCTFFALTRLPVSDVLTLTNTFPIWVALLSWPLLGERPSSWVWLAVACGVTGVILIQQPHIAAGNFASLVALASSVTTALALLGLHRLQHIDVRAIVVHFSAVSLLFCLAALFAFDHGSPVAVDLAGGPVLMLLGVGVTATVGQLFLTKAFAAGPPAKVSVIGLTQVVFAMAIDAVLWQRSFNPATLLGMALVLAPAARLMLRQKAPVMPPANGYLPALAGSTADTKVGDQSSYGSVGRHGDRSGEQDWFVSSPRPPLNRAKETPLRNGP